MPRSTNLIAILAKIETTAGVDAVPTAATDGLLLTGKPDVTPLEIGYASRDLLLPYFGGSQDLVANVNSKISFSVEWSPSGVAGTAAAWSALLRGCGCAQTVLATPARVEHTPQTTGMSTITLYVYDSGTLQRLTGCMGNAKFSAKVGETPKIMFEFLGIANAPTAAIPVPSVNQSAWKPPLPIAVGNVTDITLGCTYTAGVLSGGTTYPSNGLEFDLGQKPIFFRTASTGVGAINGRASTCSFELDLTDAQEVAAWSDIRSNVTTSLGFTIGSAAGFKQTFHAPNLARKGFKRVDKDGFRMLGFDGQLLPVSGNDEWRIVQL